MFRKPCIYEQKSMIAYIKNEAKMTHRFFHDAIMKIHRISQQKPRHDAILKTLFIEICKVFSDRIIERESLIQVRRYPSKAALSRIGK